MPPGSVEIALPEAGVIAFQHGFAVWCDVVGAETLVPSDGILDAPAGDSVP